MANGDSLGGYNCVGTSCGPDRIVQELQTPLFNGQQIETDQGYWGSPAYWEWTSGASTTRAIYYSVDATSEIGTNTPFPLNMYVLIMGTSPLPATPSNSSKTRFCGHGGAPSVSSTGTTPNTGIVWALEQFNSLNIPPTPTCNGVWGPAILHAYDASNLGNGTAELYNSINNVTSDNYPTHFLTPMVFNGKVYMGTKNAKPPNLNGPYGQGQVDVFGLCGGANPPCRN